MDRSELTRIDDYQWEVPVSYSEALRVPIRIFATEEIVGRVAASEALDQALKVAALPGLVGRLVLMPDAHAGRGAPFGMVAAMKHSVGVVVPEAIGRDINCGVRLLGSSIDADEAEDALDTLADALRAHVPTGAEAESTLSLTKSEVDHVARSGAQWALRRQMAEQDDLVRAEEGGRLNEADPEKVSAEARALGARQLGTLGGGEHFVEVSVVEEVFHRAAAFTMGLTAGALVVQIHSGSRGYGRQVCSDYIERFQNAGADGAPLCPGLACMPLESAAAQDYMGAMRAAANYAYANRQVLAHRVREAFDEAFDGRGAQLRTVYDVAHNLGQLEMHEVEGKHMHCYVHRKGAARAFGPGTPGISLPYRALGQPVLVPGRWGTPSWVLLGTLQSMQRSFGSACHGAGCAMSNHEAGYDGGAALGDAAGSRARAGGEAVQVQEDIDAVVEAVVGAGLAAKVARLRTVTVVHA